MNVILLTLVLWMFIRALKALFSRPDETTIKEMAEKSDFSEDTAKGVGFIALILYFILNAVILIWLSYVLQSIVVSVGSAILLLIMANNFYRILKSLSEGVLKTKRTLRTLYSVLFLGYASYALIMSMV